MIPNRIDSEMAKAIEAETGRQRDNLLMIASENYASQAVMEAHTSVVTNKYAEDYPADRYYGGCEHVNIVESLAIERAKRVFEVEFANVQSHSGSQANMAVYFSFLKPGDTILGMNLSHGGHLSHGSTVGVDRQTHRSDFDQIKSLARSSSPKLIIAGASSYPSFVVANRDSIRFDKRAKAYQWN